VRAIFTPGTSTAEVVAFLEKEIDDED
jgi:methylmalonyl-CoA mutase cobalamin-binding subunit